MNNYRTLAVKYLQLNKKRSRLTIIGVSITVMILYAILNLGWSALLAERENIRKEADYELVFLTENMSQIEQISADEKVKSAYVGAYYDYDYYDPVAYDTALYVNTTNPYKVLKIRAELESRYGVKSELNDDLASTYLQSVDGDILPALILMVLLISFIFAIFGVGIVRNSIQLSTLEQIKDYGNMRCIGASKGQLRKIIYLEGAILEGIGCVIGIVLGFVVSCIIGYFLKLNVGLHVIAMIPVVGVFFFDLYFAMDENCKVVMNMTPVSAIRGDFRIRKEKIKARRRNLFGLLFGVEGDYAYKSVMRNPGRFMRTVWALGLAVAAFIAIVGSVTSIQYFANQTEEKYKYYQVAYGWPMYPYQTIDEVKSGLPPTEILENVGALREVTEAKKLYASMVMTTSYETLCEHYTDEYSDYFELERILEIMDTAEEYWQTRLAMENFSLECYGYDEADYARYEEMLVDGTLDLSENGILLVNGGEIEVYDEETLEDFYTSILIEMQYISYTDYEVGDTIDIVNSKRLRELTAAEWERLDKECEAEIAKLPEQEEPEYPFEDTPEQELKDKYQREKWRVYKEIYRQLIDEGAYRSYVIEGILKDDANYINYGPRIILPMEHYYALTGTDESMVCGMQYHFKNLSYDRYMNASDYDVPLDEESWYDTWSPYADFRHMVEEVRKLILGVGCAILFVILMTTLNIMNTTASNLHLRRKELAQLRVIGVSKLHLTKMVLLEGVISSIVANVIGITIGLLLSNFVFEMIFGIMYGLDYHLSVVSVIVGVLLSTAILCGSVYVGIKELKQDVATDLMAGGD